MTVSYAVVHFELLFRVPLGGGEVSLRTSSAVRRGP